MTGFQAVIEGNFDALYDASKSSGGGSFPPLPRGAYQAVVRPLKNDGSQLTEVVDFSKKPEYAGKKAVRVAFAIVDESPTGAKRYFTTRIPLFTAFASGKPAFLFFNFFEAVGVSKEDLARGVLPGPQDIMGKRVTIFLGEPKEPDQWNELGSNEISSIGSPYPDVSRTPIRRPGVPVAAWLDADDNLLPGYGAAQLQAPAGQPAWGVSQADAAAATPQQTPWPQAASQPAAAWPPTASSLQEAAQSAGVGY